MSGPPFPPGPFPGSNAIGSFIIGVSPIGTITPFNIWTTIISQYANSPILVGLIESFFDSVDQTADIEAFFDLVWNVDTAQGWGLDVWGRIVGVSRTLNVPNADLIFGFEEASTLSAQPFNQAPFFQGTALTTNYQLSDAAFRVLILAKAASNISDGSIKSINAILGALFKGRGNCYVIDGLDMSMEYHFEFALSPVELAILGQAGALPKPTGVLATVTEF